MIFAVMEKRKKKMPKYINAEVLQSRLEDFSRWCKDGRKEGVDFVIDCPLPDIPTADVQEVRRGRWISNDLGGYKWAYYCSECGWVDGYPFNDRHKYCPHCGAKMDVKEQAMSKEKQNDPTDDELAEAAEDAYNNIIRSLIEATADRNDLVRKLRDAYKMILDLLKGAEISAMYTHVSVLLNKLNEEYSDVL